MISFNSNVNSGNNTSAMEESDMLFYSQGLVGEKVIMLPFPVPTWPVAGFSSNIL